VVQKPSRTATARLQPQHSILELAPVPAAAAVLQRSAPPPAVLTAQQQTCPALLLRQPAPPPQLLPALTLGQTGRPVGTHTAQHTSTRQHDECADPVTRMLVGGRRPPQTTATVQRLFLAPTGSAARPHLAPCQLCLLCLHESCLELQLSPCLHLSQLQLTGKLGPATPAAVSEELQLCAEKLLGCELSSVACAEPPVQLQHMLCACHSPLLLHCCCHAAGAVCELLHQALLPVRQL
jgi:hypothetical protein